MCDNGSHEEEYRCIGFKGYKDAYLCKGCDKKFFVASPGKGIDVNDQAFAFVAQTTDGKETHFQLHCELKEFVQSQVNAIVEFGIKDILVAKDLAELKAKCKQLMWEKIPYIDRWSFNTSYEAKPEFWSFEKKRVDHELKTWTKRRKIVNEKQ